LVHQTPSQPAVSCGLRVNSEQVACDYRTKEEQSLAAAKAAEEQKLADEAVQARAQEEVIYPLVYP